MRQPLLDAVHGLDPAADAPEIDAEAMLARIHRQAATTGRRDDSHLLPPTRSRPARRLAMGAAALSAIMAIALVLTLTQQGPQAYASWVAEPTLVEPAVAAERCPDTEAGPPPVPVEPVLAEQRGSYTFAVLVGEGVIGECLVSAAGGEGSVIAQFVTPADPAAFDLGEAPVLVLYPGETLGVEGGVEGPITTVVGLAADDVTAVRVSTTDGVVAEAAIEGGWWSVWFPGDVEVSDDLVVETPEGEGTYSLESLIAPGI